ncbi:hypothetical protein GCM10011340_21130 [Roseivirga thermotolerans]|uniref:Uncharacterized protein n=1 Tax=Roseivirga thermotolerans TaxID=1758176 RepID=A0ABQ3I5B6_9BACT|nr:hypothetical protein GCM10011340_21130 [Roseivirga thermotolerans]
MAQLSIYSAIHGWDHIIHSINHLDWHFFLIRRKKNKIYNDVCRRGTYSIFPELPDFDRYQDIHTETSNDGHRKQRFSIHPMVVQKSKLTPRTT